MGDTMINLKCPECGNSFFKRKAEVTRQLKKNPNTQFYCCQKCAIIGGHKKQQNPIVTKTCPVCKELFATKSGAKEATFCSRSCASKGSVTEARRQAGRYAAELNFTPETHNIINIQKVLKEREAWKYEKIKIVLDFLHANYEFEYLMGNYIYDLAIFDKGILVEFDGPDHRYCDDTNKYNNTLYNGWYVYRINVNPNEIIDPSFLYSLNRPIICPIEFI